MRIDNPLFQPGDLNTVASASFIPSFEWIDGGTITIAAVPGGTTPAKGTTTYDKVRYRKINSDTYEVDYNFYQTTAGTAGNLQYLFSLPAGITWGPGVSVTTSNTIATYLPVVLPTDGQYLQVGSFLQRIVAVLPYDSTRFRLIGADLDGQFSQISSVYFALSNAGMGYKIRFYTTV